MGAIVPLRVAESDASRYLASCGLRRIYQGKVRDTYSYPVEPELLLPLATDRVSIFDFVLSALIPRKGEVLTALTHFWLTTVLRDFPNHLAPAEELLRLKRMFSQLPMERCLVVKRAEIPPYEMIFRHHLGGSVYKEYLGTGTAGGNELPKRLTKWSFLEEPIFTPTTKEERGHDKPIPAQEYFEQTGEAGRQAEAMFRAAYGRAYAFGRSRGILILDTKFEGRDMIADEVLTPDSSRFTTEEDFVLAMAQKRDPIFFDKQVVRDWGVEVQTPWGKGIGNLDAKNPEHIAFVHSLEVPAEVVKETAIRYFSIFSSLTSWDIDAYQWMRRDVWV